VAIAGSGNTIRRIAAAPRTAIAELRTGSAALRAATRCKTVNVRRSATSAGREAICGVTTAWAIVAALAIEVAWAIAATVVVLVIAAALVIAVVLVIAAASVTVAVSGIVAVSAIEVTEGVWAIAAAALAIAAEPRIAPV
jgi:hypothetical protein